MSPEETIAHLKDQIATLTTALGKINAESSKSVISAHEQAKMLVYIRYTSDKALSAVGV